MTNEMIILTESVKLMNDGVLKGTGEYVTVTGEDGKEREIELPEPIHTFNGWKQRGYSVKKGEKSKIRITIWKHTTKRLDENTGDKETDKMNSNINAQGGEKRMFMKVACFFTAEQVEPIKAKA